MTSSPKRDQPIDPLPPALVDVAVVQIGISARAAPDGRSVCVIAARGAPGCASRIVADASRQRVLEHNPALNEALRSDLACRRPRLWFLRTVSTRVQRRFRDRVTIALETHVARLRASIATIAHQERPEYLDRLSMLRNQVFVLDHMYMSLFSTLVGSSALG